MYELKCAFAGEFSFAGIYGSWWKAFRAGFKIAPDWRFKIAKIGG